MLRNRPAVGLVAWRRSIPSPGYAMERAAMDQILAMAKARPDSPEFREALVEASWRGADQERRGVRLERPRFRLGCRGCRQPTLVVDDQPVGAMRRIAGSNCGSTRAAPCRDVAPVSLPDRRQEIRRLVRHARVRRRWYARPGVPQGRISEKLVHTSKLYGGMQSNYWIYVPAQYNPAVPAALMVWQDGERYITRNVEELCRLCPACTGCRKSPTI